MSWPPAPSAAFVVEGATTIRFGTDGIMPNTSPNGNGAGGFGGSYTVESMRGADKIDGALIGQGTGLDSTRVQLIQGRRYTLTIVDDTNMTPPRPGSPALLTDTISGGQYVYSFIVIDNGNLAQRKQEHRREITVEYLTVIEGAGNTPAQGGGGQDFDTILPIGGNGGGSNNYVSS